MPSSPIIDLTRSSPSLGIGTITPTRIPKIDPKKESSDTDKVTLATEPRVQFAMAFDLILDQIEMMLKYAVIGWVGTFQNQEQIDDALSRATEHVNIQGAYKLRQKLSAAIQPFLAREGAEALEADQVKRVKQYKECIMKIKPGQRATKYLTAVMKKLEKEMRVVGILPPENNAG